MIVPKTGHLTSVRLRGEVAGLRRVLIARTDGIAVYDDAALEQRDSGAAITSTVLGLAQGAAATLALGNVVFTVALCDFGCVFVYPIDSEHLLAVVTDPDVDTGALGDATYREIELINGRVGAGAA